MTVRGPMISVAAGRSLAHVQWLRWRADLARPELPSHSDERLFLPAAAAVIVAVAQLSDPGSVVDLLFLVPAVGAFVARGLAPSMPAELFAVLVIAPVVAVVGGEGVLEGSFFLVVLMVLYVAWQLGSTSRATVIAVAAAVAPWLVAMHLAPDDDIGWTAWTSACVFTFALGRVLRRQQALIDQLEQARNALAEQAVAEERRRIARELHDLAGHTLAAVLLHVTGARHVLRRDVDEAERALADAEAVGRSSLDQIRATVAAPSDARAGHRSRPRRHRGSHSAGGGVSAGRPGHRCHDRRHRRALDGPLGTALHRIAREALANVARHAPRNDVELTLDVRPRCCAARVVVDRGRPAPAPDPGAGHFGLIGMRERARALGGDLEAGPTAEGWRVEAHLPTAVVRGPVVARDPSRHRRRPARRPRRRRPHPRTGRRVRGRGRVRRRRRGRQRCGNAPPDLVLMDVRMRRVDGVAATRLLRQAGEEPPVLILTTFDDDDALWGALDAGAEGFVFKDTTAEDLLAAARAVAAGAAWLDPKVAPRVLQEFRATVRPRLAQAVRVDELTEREHDVLRRSHVERPTVRSPPPSIVSEATIKSHVGSIFAKLGVRDRAAAIVFAYDHGIVEPLPRTEGA